MGNYTILSMFENPRRGRQARNITTNVPKILVLKSSSEHIFSRKLSLGAPGGSFDRPACLQTKEDSGRGITTATDKEIQSRNEARIPQNTKSSTICLHASTRVWDDWLKNGTPYHDWNCRILKTLFNFELSFWLWKSMNQQLGRSVNVAEKKHSSVSF